MYVKKDKLLGGTNLFFKIRHLLFWNTFFSMKMHRMKNLLTFLFLCFTNSFFAQSNQALTLIEQVVESHADFEKIYIHTDRDYYTAGGDIFFKIYLTDENLVQKQAESKVAYVELISPDEKILQTRTIALKEGNGIGDFKVTSKFISGQYVIRAYTNYMRNFDAAFFFRKSIYIRGVTNLDEKEMSSKNEVAVQFFPESGDLVEGISSTVAIKAMNNTGTGTLLKGKILVDGKSMIAEVFTNQNGFGYFTLKPEPNRTYSFEGLHEGKLIKITLPSALKNGVVVSIDNSDEELIRLDIATNLNGGYLVGQAKGKIFFKQLVKAQKANLELPVEEIPFGVLHFTFFDELGQPRAERLVFNHDGIDNFNVDFSTNKAAYNKREKVQLKLDLFDDDGQSIPAELSLTVVDNALQNVFADEDNIQSYLLLSSDIKGKIEQPAIYFKDTEKTTKKALDLLLMTQGWRRFKWQDALKNPINSKLFQAEQHLSLAGKVTKKNDKAEPVKAVGYLSELTANLSMIPFETDEKGLFVIDNLYANADTEMVLQAATLNKKQRKITKNSYALKGDRNINISLVKKKPIVIQEEDRIFLKKITEEKIVRLSNLERVSFKNDLAYEDVDLTVDIDSIEVTAQRIDEVVEYYEDGMLYNRPDTRIRMDKVANPDAHQDILSIIVGKAPGVNYDIAEGGLIFRGKQTGLSASSSDNKARFMVNGALASEEFVSAINPTDVAFVDILRSLNQLVMYGELGSNGLVMIYLKTPKDRAKKPQELKGITNFTFQGYHQARAFYQPVYSVDNLQNAKVDNRVTLHWQPTVSFNDLGEAYIEFYTSDRAGTFDVLVEGITQYGLPIVGGTQINVK